MDRRFWQAPKRALVASVALGLLGIAVGAGVILATTSDAGANLNDNPFAGGFTMSTQMEQSSEFKLMLRSEAEQLSYWLNVLANPAAPCATPCERVSDPVMTWTGIAERCNKLGPSDWIVPARALGRDDEIVARSVADACDAVTLALRKNGQPDDSPAWRSRAAAARAPLTAAQAQILTSGEPD